MNKKIILYLVIFLLSFSYVNAFKLNILSEKHSIINHEVIFEINNEKKISSNFLLDFYMKNISFDPSNVKFDVFEKKTIFYNVTIQMPIFENVTINNCTNNTIVHSKHRGSSYCVVEKVVGYYNRTETKEKDIWVKINFTKNKDIRQNKINFKSIYPHSIKKQRKKLYRVVWRIPIKANTKRWGSSGYFGIKDNITGVDLDPWWDSSWSYRKTIYINNTAQDLYGYQININVTYNSNMQTDFDDLRFTWYNSTSGLEEEIPYWVEEKVDGSWASVWVRVPYLPTTNDIDTVKMYYGNPTVSNNSDGFDTFDFFDDFEDGVYTDKWTIISGTWSESSGVLTSSGGTGWKKIRCSYATPSSGGYAIVYRIKLGGDDYASSTIYFEDLDNHIQAQIRFANDIGRINDRYGAVAHNYDSPVYSMDGSVWNLYKIKTPTTTKIIQGLNSHTLQTVTVSGNNVGTIFEVWLGYYVGGSIDDLRIYKYVEPEPIYSFGAEESGVVSQSYYRYPTQQISIVDVTPNSKKMCIRTNNEYLNLNLGLNTLSKFSREPSELISTNEIISKVRNVHRSIINSFTISSLVSSLLGVQDHFYIDLSDSFIMNTNPQQSFNYFRELKDYFTINFFEFKQAHFPKNIFLSFDLFDSMNVNKHFFRDLYDKIIFTNYSYCIQETANVSSCGVIASNETGYSVSGGDGWINETNIWDNDWETYGIAVYNDIYQNSYPALEVNYTKPKDVVDANFLIKVRPMNESIGYDIYLKCLVGKILWLGIVWIDDWETFHYEYVDYNETKNISGHLLDACLNKSIVRVRVELYPSSVGDIAVYEDRMVWKIINSTNEEVGVYFNWRKKVEDTFLVSQDVLKNLVLFRNIDEPIDVLSNVSARFKKIYREYIYESLILKETIFEYSEFFRNIFDSMKINEFLSFFDKFNRGQSLSVFINEAIVRSAFYEKYIMNKFSTTEIINTQSNFYRNIKSIFNVNGDIDNFFKYFRDQASFININEHINNLYSFTRKLSDVINLNEETRQNYNLIKVVSDSFVISSTIANSFNFFRISTDIINYFENTLRYYFAQINIYDSFSMKSSVNTKYKFYKPILSTINIIDTAVKNVKLNIRISESFSVLSSITGRYSCPIGLCKLTTVTSVTGGGGGSCDYSGWMPIPKYSKYIELVPNQLIFKMIEGVDKYVFELDLMSLKSIWNNFVAILNRPIYLGRASNPTCYYLFFIPSSTFIELKYAQLVLFVVGFFVLKFLIFRFINRIFTTSGWEKDKAIWWSYAMLFIVYNLAFVLLNSCFYTFPISFILALIVYNLIPVSLSYIIFLIKK